MQSNKRVLEIVDMAFCGSNSRYRLPPPFFFFLRFWIVTKLLINVTERGKSDVNLLIERRFLVR